MTFHKVTQFSGRYLGGAETAFLSTSLLKNEGFAKYIVRCKTATVANKALPFVDFTNDTAALIVTTFLRT